MTRTAIAIRHLAFEDLGSFETVLVENGFQVRYIDAGINDFDHLDPAEDDVAIILGGPTGACDDRFYPTLKAEAAYIEERLLQGRPIMGICLGAQLIARSLGSRVYRASEKEIGFFAVDLTPRGGASCLASLRGAPVLHWHGDTFDLPTGAVKLASTRVCENQAFSYGDNAIAFQFHPEIGAAGFERWLVGHAFELDAARLDVNELRRKYHSIRFDLESRAHECLLLLLREIEAISGSVLAPPHHTTRRTGGT